MTAGIAALAAAAIATADPGALRLPVPVVRQAPERCGPAALQMVMRFHGADSAALAAAERAYDPALRGALVTDLAAAARGAGFAAVVARPPEDSLATLLGAGVPPILLYAAGPAPLTRPHYGVLVGWDAGRDELVIHDGGVAPRRMRRASLLRRWRAAGGVALLVTPAP